MTINFSSEIEHIVYINRSRHIETIRSNMQQDDTKIFCQLQQFFTYMVSDALEN